MTNTVLDSQFRGTSQQFVLHFNEQFRTLDELLDLTERMPESIKMAFLQNAVKEMPQLSIVETLDEYISTTSGTGHAHTSPTYPTTIFSSVLVFGMMLPILPPSKRRNIYSTAGAYDHSGTAEPHGVQFSPDIDTPSDDFYQVYQTKYGKQPSTPLSGFQKDHHRNSTPSAPKKPFKKYDGPVYVPAEVYKLLSSEAVAALKKYNSEAINKFAKKRGIHVTDIADHESSPSDDTLLRTNQTLSSLRMHLKMRLTQS